MTAVRMAACIALCVLVALPAMGGAVGLAPVVLDPAVGEHDIDADVELVEDPGGAASIDDVTREPLASRFAPAGGGIASKGLSASAWWVRLRLHNPSDAPAERMLEVARATIDRVELYFPDGFEPRMKANHRFARFSERDVAHRNHVFRVTVPPASTITLHLRITSESELYFPLRVWTADALRKHERDEHMVMAVFYGATLMLALYHLVLFFRIRERHLLYFVSYITIFGTWIWLVDGMGNHLLEGIVPALGTHPFVITGWGGMIFATLFTQAFLDTRRRAPRVDRALYAIYVAAALVIALSLLGLISWRTVNVVTTILFVTGYPALFATGLVVWRGGMPEAAWYSVSWAVWLAAGVAGALFLSGVIAIPLHEGLNPLRWGILGEALCMSVALGYRIEKLGEERAEAKSLALAQGTMAEAERSAALGRLMAGILHEVNTPLGALRSAAGTLGTTFSRIAGQLAGRDESDEKTRRAIEAGQDLTRIIDEGSQRIAGVVDSLRRFVAVDEAAKKRSDVREGLDGALTLLASSIGEGIRVTRDYPEEPALATCAPAKLNHALLELLAHALGRMDRGTLHVAVAAADDGVTITIRDEGSAIAADDLARMFELRFDERLGTVRTNLGLPLAKQAIEEHGGHVRAESGETGLTITIALPS